MLSVRVEDAREGRGPGASDDSGDGEIEAILPFFTGNPRIERLRGTIRLFRPVPTSAEEVAAAYEVSSDPLPRARGTQVCVLAVPSYMTPADFCAFVGPCIEHVVRMRILHDASPEKYMVLMQFANQQATDDFHTLYNCKPFSSLDEAERCLVVFARSVDLDAGDDATWGEAGWEGWNGGEAQEQQSQHPAGDDAAADAGERGTGDGNGEEKEVPLTELPGCPVCLERLDVHVSGIVTTSCNHSFHTECLSRWSDSSCPVCRYCAQQPSAASQCERCGSRSNLWICVICGHVGCGRYGEGHGLAHFTETNHCYAMELETHNVWDYVGDNFVHRLIENGRDGKIVELERGGRDAVHGAGTGLGEDGPADTPKGGRAGGRHGPGGGTCHVCEGVLARSVEGKGHPGGAEADVGGKGRADGEMQERLVREYNALLTSQLEEQRRYFEGLLEREKEAATSASDSAGTALAERDEARERARAAEAARDSLESKLARSRAKAQEASREGEFLRELNDALVANQKGLQASIQAAEAALATERAKTADLEEQVRDLMMFLEGGRAIAAAGGTAEVGAGGSVAVGPRPRHEPRTRKR